MRVACSASLRVTPLETRACFNVSPNTPIVAVRLPHLPYARSLEDLVPPRHAIGFDANGQPSCVQCPELPVGSRLQRVLRAAAASRLLAGNTIEMRSSSAMR